MTTCVFYYNFVPEALHCPGIQVLHCYLGGPDREIQTNSRTKNLVDTQMKVWAFLAVFAVRAYNLGGTNFASPTKQVKTTNTLFSFTIVSRVI